MSSKIEWTEETWNPVTGCTKVSPGCDNCYAERMAKRLKGMGVKGYENGFEVVCHPDRLEAPLHWRKPRVIFVCSMGDLFHEDVPFDFIDQVYAVMALAPQHTFLVLTKRAERMAEYFNDSWRQVEIGIEVERISDIDVEGIAWPLTNAWHGVTAEDQQRADERIHQLLKVPGKRFLSIEPMLGPTRIDNVYNGYFFQNPLTGHRWHDNPDGNGASDNHGEKIHTVILGGESGPGARPMHPDWARSVRDQCAAADVPFFFKQWGEWRPRVGEWEPKPFGIFPSGDYYQAGLLMGPVNSEAVEIGRLHPGEQYEMIHRVGKKKAGRLLDGREHNDLPWGGGNQ